MNLIDTIITSTIFATIAGAIVNLMANNQLKKVERKLNAKNKEIEINLNAIKAKQKYEYELVISSLTKIWEQITIMEDYFLLKMSSEGFKLDPQFKPIRESVHNVRNNMLFLPDNLYSDISKFLEILFEEYIQEYSDSVTSILKENSLYGKQGVVSADKYPKAISSLQEALHDLQKKFWFSRDELRKKIRNGLVNYSEKINE